MTTTADYKAMITTEIRVPLAQIPDEDVENIIGKNGRNLKIIENNSNTRCSWDKKNLSIYIQGEPKATKEAYTIIMAQMSKFASANGTTAPEATVNMLGKEYVDGVQFCKLADAAESSDDEDAQNDDETRVKTIKVKPAVFVVHPVTMTDQEKQKGRVMASELWRNAQFVAWDFKDNVIQDASMVLRRRLRQLPQGEEKYLKLEMDIGKVIFLENDKKHFSLQGAKFAISEFRHLRFDKEITSKFRKEWEEPWILRLRSMLPTLGYQKGGCMVKHVKISHTAQREDGKCYEVVWTTDILEGKKLGDAKPGTLEFVKARVRGNNAFSATVYGPATAFDFRFSIVTNTRESATNNREIESRVRRAYRYSTRRGLLVNHPYENCNGYTPLVNPKAKLTRETTWIRGDIKVIINEIEDGEDCTFEVKIQSNLLKKYAREEPGDVSLSDMVEAVKDLLEAAEEINGELNLLTAELPSRQSQNLVVTENDTDNLCLTSPSVVPHNYGTLSASIHSSYGTSKAQARHPMDKPTFERASTQVAARIGEQALQMFSSDSSEDNISQKELLFTLESSFENADFGTQPKKGLMSPRSPDSPTVGVVGTEAFWESQEIGIDGFGFTAPILIPKKALQGSLSAAEGVIFKHDETKVKQVHEPKPVSAATIAPPNGNSPTIANLNTTHRKQGPITGPNSPLPPHLRPVARSTKPSTSAIVIHSNTNPPGNPSSIKQLRPSKNNFSDRFFDLLDSATDEGSSPSVGVLTPKKVVSPRSGKMMIDFFGSVGSLKGGDAEDLLSWNPDKDAFTYIHESGPPQMELGEGVSLLLD